MEDDAAAAVPASLRCMSFESFAAGELTTAAADCRWNGLNCTMDVDEEADGVDVAGDAVDDAMMFLSGVDADDAADAVVDAIAEECRGSEPPALSSGVPFGSLLCAQLKHRWKSLLHSA